MSSIKSSFESPTFVDLFCGAGGFSLGFEMAGFRSVFAIDKHPDPIRTYCYNRPGLLKKQCVFIGDIRQITGKNIIKKISALNNIRNKVDVIIGGPPCQGFSNRGKRQKNDPRNNLVYEYLKIVDDIKPEIFVFENVPGMLHEKNQSLLEDIVMKIEKMQYSYFFNILNAFDYGVPQNRQRLILIGRKSEEKIIFPKRSKKHFLKDVVKDLNYKMPIYDAIPIVKNPVNVREALDDISYLQVNRSPILNNRKSVSIYQQELRKKTNKIYNHITTKHRKSSVELYKLLEPGQEMKDLPLEIRNKRWSLRRMMPGELARTITACNEDFVHYSQDRIITIREMARLQSYPDDYIFQGTRTTGSYQRKTSCCQVQQVANSVPPLLAQAIAEAVLKMLGYESNGKLKTFIIKLNNRS